MLISIVKPYQSQDLTSVHALAAGACLVRNRPISFGWPATRELRIDSLAHLAQPSILDHQPLALLPYRGKRHHAEAYQLRRPN